MFVRMPGGRCDNGELQKILYLNKTVILGDEGLKDTS